MAASVSFPGATPFEAELDMQASGHVELRTSLSCRMSSRRLSLAVQAPGDSGPQGSVVPLTVVSDPAAWKAADWAGREEEAVVCLDAADVAQVKLAVQRFSALGRPLASLRRPSDFPLSGALAAKLARVRHDLLRGHGFALLRGLPVREWEERECLAAYLGLGAHIGSVQPQSKDGKLVNHVKMHHPVGTAAAPLPQREHAHNREFVLHTDAQADVLGLLCINQAKEGGVSSFSSTLAVHNEMLRRGRTDLVACMAGGGFYRDRSRYQDLSPGDSPLWEMPVFSYHGGFLTTHYNSTHYRLCCKKYGELAGQLSAQQEEALALFEEIGGHPDFAISYRLQPGDIILLHNSSILHARSAFTDGDAPHERRHLVRLWLGCRDDRPQPAHLDFPRSYTSGYDRDSFVGLMKPDPAAFHVPLSAEADEV